MDIFPLVYRCAVVVKPKQPLLDWLIKIDPADNPTLEEIQEDCNIYLIPDDEDADNIDKAIDKYLKLNYTQIFLHELSEWYLDTKVYPKSTYSLFQEWFDISIHTMIYDTVNQPITKE
jgi:hypothetical protein